MPDTAAPWERQPGEPARAYAAFCMYRNLGPTRSLREVCRRFYQCETRAKLAQLEFWSRTWRWVERTQAWDEELDRQARQAQVEAVREMNARQAQAGRALQEKALQRLLSMNPDELEPLDVVRFIVEGAKVERTAMGEPTEITQTDRMTWESLIRALRRQRGLDDAGEAAGPGMVRRDVPVHPHQGEAGHPVPAEPHTA